MLKRTKSTSSLANAPSRVCKSITTGNLEASSKIILACTSVEPRTFDNSVDSKRAFTILGGHALGSGVIVTEASLTAISALTTDTASTLKPIF